MCPFMPACKDFSLSSWKVGTKNLILEWNGKILTEKDPLATLELKDGDTVNLFSMVGGG